MLKLNDNEVKITRFPDNSFKFDLEKNFVQKVNEIVWHFESMEELFTLIGLMEKLKSTEVNLYLPYVPNARMDKIQDNREGLMIKYFIKTLDNLGFNRITILDPHSEVYKKWAKKTEWVQDDEKVKSIINEVISHIGEVEGDNVTLVYPDKGARDRYTTLIDVDNTLYGVKERNQSTGEITNFDLIGDIPNNPVLIVDDISSYGGTFYFTAKKLREKGFKGNIYLYITHAENSIGEGKLLKENSEIKKVFTTNSLVRKDYENVTTINLEEIK